MISKDAYSPILEIIWKCPKELSIMFGFHNIGNIFLIRRLGIIVRDLLYTTECLKESPFFPPAVATNAMADGASRNRIIVKVMILDTNNE